ncbi:hypothetical protein PsYK624_160860 [Phanerochaete sordida]|uniref:Uncharacterized protein n=1 Tax=Phanerochaete sordida TaxID=48140 RepID=A0A9P3GV29_9APHY|nr:hypothetical protein PsYK624_160860 [Phanerochaete sordida]
MRNDGGRPALLDVSDGQQRPPPTPSNFPGAKRRRARCSRRSRGLLARRGEKCARRHTSRDPDDVDGPALSN